MDLASTELSGVYRAEWRQQSWAYTALNWFDRLDLLVNKFVFSKHLDDIAKANNRMIAQFHRNCPHCSYNKPAAEPRGGRKRKEEEAGPEGRDKTADGKKKMYPEAMHKFYIDSFDVTLLTYWRIFFSLINNVLHAMCTKVAIVCKSYFISDRNCLHASIIHA